MDTVIREDDELRPDESRVTSAPPSAPPPERMEKEPPPRGHPRGLYMLFFAEMWERFSYYGMRALLLLYCIKRLHFSDGDAYLIYGAYGTLVYATPVLGGLLADRLLGYRTAIMMGAVLMALGHFAMAVENRFFLYLALSLLVVGNGFFKPNISSLVGTLYEKDDPRRDGGFTIFYMGINLGAFFSPLLCGFVGERFGWSYGFGLAGVGMLAGLAVFARGQGIFGERGLAPDPQKLRRRWFGLKFIHLVQMAPFLALPVIALLIQHNHMLQPLLIGIGLVVFGFLVKTALECPPADRDRLFVVMVLTLFSVMFWAFFEQAGSSLTLYTDRNVDRHLLGWLVPTSWFQSVNPVFIMLLAPLFSSMWLTLDRKRWNPSTPMKFALGILQVGLGFGALVIGTRFASPAGMVPMIFIVLAYFVHTTGELSLSPVGLSMVTKLAPQRIVAVVMGTWFLSVSFAEYIGGWLATLTAVHPEGGRAVSAVQSLPIYTDIFGKIALVALGVSLLLCCFVPILKRWMHGVK